MKKISFYKIVVLALIFDWSSLALGATQCQALFYSQHEVFETVTAPFINKFATSFEIVDFTDFASTSKLVGSMAIRFATEPELKPRTAEFVAQLNKLITERDLISAERNDKYGPLLHEMVQLLELNLGSVTLWKKYLSSTNSENNTSGVVGYLLQALPEKTKTPLLRWLGKQYLGPNKRKVTQPIHVLLNPVALYRQYKKEKRSNREFYNDYLAQIKRRVFADQDFVGGYSGDMVIAVARSAQAYLKTRPDMQAVNFLGSVPNGFATPKSDLDIFNHPVESFYPEKAALAKQMGSGSRVPNPIEAMMVQIDDPVLGDQIEKITESTPWRWHLENHGDHADEHFGAGVHVFSFHITKDKIVLRLYDSFNQDHNGKFYDNYHYIDLNIDI